MNLAEMLKQADVATQGVEVGNTEFSTIEPGSYNVAVTGAEGPLESQRTNPNNPAEHGQYIQIEFTITDGKFANRKVWMNNNIIVYPKDTSVDAGQKATKAMAMGARERKVLLDSIGKSGIENAVELVGATAVAQIANETYNGKVKSVVKSLKTANEKRSCQPTDPMCSVRTPEGCASIGLPASDARPSPMRAKMPWEK